MSNEKKDDVSMFPQNRDCVWNSVTGESHVIREEQKGISLRQYAAIHLQQPDSGLDWLDDMIRKAKSEGVRRTLP